MLIVFSPVRADLPHPSLYVIGETLVVDGHSYDLSSCTEETPIEPEMLDCPWIADPVRRVSGRVHVRFLLTHGRFAPVQTRFPAPVDVTEDGPVALPPYDEV